MERIDPWPDDWPEDEYEDEDEDSIVIKLPERTYPSIPARFCSLVSI